MALSKHQFHHHITAVSGQYIQGSVSISDSGKVVYHADVFVPNATAHGFFNETLNQTGWGILDIHAGYNAAASDPQMTYAAGFLEGRFTAEQMWMNYMNMRSVFFEGKSEKVVKKVEDFLLNQEQWAKKNVKLYASKDVYWRHVGLILAQLDGLYDGYKSIADPSWVSEQSRMIVLVLNAVGDLIDLVHAVDPESRPKFSLMSHEEFEQFVHFSGHCSALVKVLGAFEDIFMSHSSWFVYAATNRIYKHYNFNVRDAATAAKALSFSSYPGFLESLDDFYLLSSQMVMLQTTNNIFDTKIYNLVKPESLLSWQRIRLANMMATSGEQWYKIMSQHNSGTYNNQYMMIDLKRVKLNQELLDGALWVVEQIPGLVKGDDQTDILRTGYWPSYNVPFYEEIYNRSGYPDVVLSRGTDYSYQLAPRAKIFRRDQGNVKDMESMKAIMRYNDYKNDPYSEGKSCNTICCRGDLLSNPTANGCYDTKVADYSMALKRNAHIISGPTRSHGLPPFSWTPSFQSPQHVGLPPKYDFSWVDTKPSL
ncbi:hypothetical protein CAPTEDRAFT_181876 [Capitella teleta]|uniref:Phospholipase B-like n=1 Tax=Capitella teleta TaxID=283909 RepID=R7UY78_CAPTE|nr:hypothetical protein CAPTEDRAFT_181876 [Capitella teleta]|eukprot:ELU08391.1 hypothetical protein CAPTEDRAFT_181876 [Capitella teleta]